MKTLLLAIGIVVLWLALVAVLLLAGRRTAAREIAAFLPNVIRLFRGLPKDPRVPRSSKLLLLFGVVWFVSPIPCRVGRAGGWVGRRRGGRVVFAMCTEIDQVRPLRLVELKGASSGRSDAIRCRRSGSRFRPSRFGKPSIEMGPLIGWAVLAALFLAWQGFALASGPTFPTISDLIDAVSRSVVGRWILFGLWLWVGWHVFVRGWQLFLAK